MTAGRRILAVDFGDRRTGLAATDFTGSISLPLEALIGLDDRTLANSIADLARSRESECIVVGMPFARRGEIGHRGKRTMEFVKILQRVAPCPVTTHDERYTTDEAHARLKLGGLKAARRKRLADSVSALVLLERFVSEGA